MAYVPEWERLPDALERVMAAGLTEDEAQVDICRAISDRKIALRFQITPSPYPMRVVDVSRVNVPIDLKPSDFDWEKSCLGRTWRSRAVDIDVLLSSEHVKYIELFRPDVTNVLIVGAGDLVSAGAGARGRAQRPPEKSRPAIERARRVIEELYPDGVPDQATEPNATLCRRVGAKLKESKLPDVSDDTILRAAGRRK